MIKLFKTSRFDKWLRDLPDLRGGAKIQVRIERLLAGNPGDVKPVGSGISELRIDSGPGYRVYLLRHGQTIIVLLAGGDKSSQATDIAAAQELAAQWRKEWQAK